MLLVQKFCKYAGGLWSDSVLRSKYFTCIQKVMMTPWKSFPHNWYLWGELAGHRGIRWKGRALVFTLLLIKQTDEQTRTLMARKCHDDAILESVFFNWMADCKWTVHCIPYGINFVSGISIKFLHITNWTIRYTSWYDAVGTESWQVFLRVIFTGAIIFGIERSLSNVCRVFICFACEIITYRWLSESLQ